MENEVTSAKRFIADLAKKLKHRRLIFMVMSMMIAISDAGLLLYDVTAVLLTEKPEYSTHSVTTLVLLLHVFGFYISMLGLMYNSLQKKKLYRYLSNSSVVANGALFILRFTIEVMFIEYREETHKPG